MPWWSRWFRSLLLLLSQRWQFARWSSWKGVGLHPQNCQSSGCRLTGDKRPAVQRVKYHYYSFFYCQLELSTWLEVILKMTRNPCGNCPGLASSAPNFIKVCHSPMARMSFSWKKRDKNQMFISYYLYLSWIKPEIILMLTLYLIGHPSGWIDIVAHLSEVGPSEVALTRTVWFEFDWNGSGTHRTTGLPTVTSKSWLSFTASLIKYNEIYG